MVVLFSDRKSNTEKEIIEILKKHGGDYISDKTVHSSKGLFTVVSEYKITDIKIRAGAAVFTDDTLRFRGQILPKEIIGICESQNRSALEIFEKNKTPVISCGMNPKNTLTVSSLSGNNVLLSLQRTVTTLFGTDTEPCEMNIKLSKTYTPFSIMASAALLLIHGITPQEF